MATERWKEADPLLRTADGTTIEYYGHCKVEVATREGHVLVIPFVACGVSRAILSVDMLTKKGCAVTFQHGRCQIVQGGKSLEVTKKGGLHVIPVRVEKPVPKEAVAEIAADMCPVQLSEEERAARRRELQEAARGFVSDAIAQSLRRAAPLASAPAAAAEPAEAPLVPEVLEPSAVQFEQQPVAVAREPSEAVFAQQLAAEPVETATARTLKTPSRPPAEEQELHQLTHLPYASWCKHCVQARGKEEAHRAIAGRVDAVQPLVSMDYFFLSGKERPERPDMETGIAAVDQATGSLWASMVPCTLR